MKETISNSLEKFCHADCLKLILIKFYCLMSVYQK